MASGTFKNPILVNQMRLENSLLFLPSTILFPNKNSTVSYRVYIKSTTNVQSKEKTMVVLNDRIGNGLRDYV